MNFRRLVFALLLPVAGIACSDSDSYEVGVIKPLMVVNVTPGGADNVPLDTVITAQFTENVIESSLTADSVVLADAAGAPIAGELTYDAETQTVTLTPGKPLAYSATYTLRLLKTIKRKTDKAVLAKEFVHTFKTMDPPSLTVVKSAPSGEATSIGAFVTVDGTETPYGNRAATKVIITFSEGIDTATLTAQTFTLASAEGEAVAGTFAWEATDDKAVDLLNNKIHTDDVLTFTAGAPLALSTEYTVTLKGTHDGIRSKRATEEGGFFEADVTWTFRTIDPPPLRILSTSPSTDAVNVGAFMAPDGSLSPYGDRATQEIVIRFSEGAATDTVVANFAVYALGTTTPLNGALAFSSSGTEFWQLNDTLHFIPSAWDLSRGYLVVLGKEAETFRATDTGGQLGQDFGLQFVTLDPPPLRVLFTTPSDAAVNVGTLAPDVFGDDIVQTVSIRFSEGLDTASAGANFTVVDADTATAVTGALTFASSGGAFWQQNDTLVFTPARWDPSRNYTVTVGGATESFRATTASGALVAAHAVDFDMNDPLPLFLEATFPGNGAEVSESFVADVNFGTDNGDEAVVAFVMYFSEPVEPNSLESNFTFRENTVDITALGAFTYSIDGTTVTFTPPALQLSSTYEVSLAGGSLTAPFAGVVSVRGTNAEEWYDTADDTGGYLDGDQTIWFTTPDPKPLTITAITPTVDVNGDADNVARTAAIQITFSEPVAPAVITAIETDGPSNAYASLTSEGVLAVPATYDFDAAGLVLTITPTNPLFYSTNHELEVNGGSTGIVSWRVTAVSGWLVPTGTTVYQFKTIDPAVLAIWASSPSDQEDAFGIAVSDVAVTSTLQMVFSAALDKPTFESNVSIVNCGPSTTGCASGATVTPISFSYVDYAGGAQKVVINAGELAFDTYYEITLTGGQAGIRSLENALACATICEGGYLPADHVITFKTRSRPPLEAVAITPIDGANGVNPLTNVVIEFSTEVSAATIDGFRFFVTDVTNNQLVHRFGDNAADRLYTAPATAEIVFNTPLNFDTVYNIVLLSSIQGTDGRFLARDVRFTFQTKLASLVVSTDPSDGFSNIEVDLSRRDIPGGITVYFDGPVTSAVAPEMALTVTYETGRGISALLGTVNTATVGQWTFVPDPFCTPAEDPLAFTTKYYLNISDKVWRADGSEALTGGFTSQFETAAATVISAVEATNDVPGTVPLAIDMLNDTDSLGGDANEDVPITAKLTVTFGEVINTGTVVITNPADDVNDTVLVRKVGTANYANLTNVTIGSNSVSFTIDDTTYNLVGDDMAFATDYELIVRSPIRDGVGNSLADDFVHQFTTSDAPSITLVQPGDTNKKKWGHASSAVFSKAVAPASLTDINFYMDAGNAGCGGGVAYTKMPALIALGYDAHSAAVIPTPYMAGSVCHQFRFVGGSDGPRDNRGNPFPTSTFKEFESDANDNATSNITLTQAASSPRVDVVQAVTGRQQIRIRLAVSDTAATVLPTSLKPISFWVYSDAARTIEVPGRVYYDAVNSDGVFLIDEGSYFERSNLTYYVKANRNITSSRRHECTSCVNYTFTVEGVAPTVSAFSPANGAVNQEPDVAVSITFSEPIRPETAINGINNLSVQNGGVPVAGTWSLNALHTVASFTPAMPYQGGGAYVINAGSSVLDYAGNSLTPNAAVFDVTTAGPTLVSTVPAAGANGIAVTTDITATFSKNIAPASVYASLWDGAAGILPGSIRLTSGLLGVESANEEVFACVFVNDNVVTLEPLDNLALNTQYWFGVFTGVTDLGGNAVAANYASSFTTAP